MRDYKKIKAWEFSDDLAVDVYRMTRLFPAEERYGLTNQLRRAAYSVPSNIAEGARRKTKKDYLHFLYIARGSLSETEYFCHLSHRLEFIDGDQFAVTSEVINRTFARLQGLIRAVEKEAGLLSKTVAATTSLIALTIPKLWPSIT